jgi:hypothetical protein
VGQDVIDALRYPIGVAGGSPGFLATLVDECFTVFRLLGFGEGHMD